MRTIFYKSLLFSFLFILIASYATATPDQNLRGKLHLKNPMFSIYKSSTSVGMLPSGFLWYSIFVTDENGDNIRDPKLVKKIEILDPQGKIFKTLDNQIYQPAPVFELSGYSDFLIKKDGIQWKGFDVAYNESRLPQSGKYSFVVTSISGDKSHIEFDFHPQSDPIAGFPSNIQYDNQARKVSWQPTSGQTRYSVAIYRGAYTSSPDPLQMLHIAGIYENDRITVPYYVLPEAAEIDKGQTYFVVVSAYNGFGNSDNNSNFVHMQNSQEHCAVFSGDGVEIVKVRSTKILDPSEQEPLSPMDAKYLYSVKRIAVNGNKIAYIDEGKGQPLIFIHGLSGSLATFEVLFPAMIRKGYRVIGVDLLGYGKSDKPEDITYTIPFHAETIIRLVKQLGLQDAVLVGHSMGGAVSLYAMLKEPALFRSMILLTPGGLEEYSSDSISYIENNYDVVFGNRFSDLESARKYYGETVYQWNSAMDEFFKTRARMMIHPEWIKVKKMIKDVSLSSLKISKEILPKIGDIKKPVLVLLAANDNLVSTKEVKTNIEKRTKGWKIEVFEKCGHLIQFDQTEKVIKRILEFLAKQ